MAAAEALRTTSVEVLRPSAANPFLAPHRATAESANPGAADPKAPPPLKQLAASWSEKAVGGSFDSGGKARLPQSSFS